MVTARAHPQVINNQSPAARKIVVGVAARPDPGKPATAMATTPSPKEISTNVPRNSARSSPQVPPNCLRPLPLRTVFLSGPISLIASASSSHLLHLYGLTVPVHLCYVDSDPGQQSKNASRRKTSRRGCIVDFSSQNGLVR